MTEEGQPEYDVEAWLRLIGREEYIDKTARLSKGGSVAVRNFPTVCPDAALEMFTDLEATPPDDPEFPDMVELARTIFDRHFGAQIESVE